MRLGFFRRRTRKYEKTELEEKSSTQLPWKVDLHSHLLPGIDDGSPTMEKSLELVHGLQNLGYQQIITTPHVMADSYRNTTEDILQGANSLRKKIEENGLEIRLEVAAEYYLDESLDMRLRQGDILTIGKDYLLFETSYYSEPLNLEETIYNISASGYRPLLAHPERYRYIHAYDKFYGRLRELGCHFQVNINSLGGYYGINAREKAYWLMERGWIDFLGSDLHGSRQLEFLRHTTESGVLKKVVAKNRLLNDLLLRD